MLAFLTYYASDEKLTIYRLQDASLSTSKGFTSYYQYISDSKKSIF